MASESCEQSGWITLISGILGLTLVLGWLLLLRRAGREALVPESEAGGRSALLDNAKFILMPFIVLTHAKCYDWPMAPGIMDFLNPWHIKTYALISGILARKPPNEKTFKSLAFRLILPNLLWSIFLYPLMHFLVEWKVPDLKELGQVWRNGFFYGQAGANWYLWGLVWWQLGSFLLQPFRSASLRLTLAVAISAVCGYLPNPLFSFTMVMSTFPVYVLGQVLPWDLLSTASKSYRSSLGCGLMLIILCLEVIPPGLGFMESIPSYAWSPNQPRILWHHQPIPCLTSGSWFMWVRGAFFRNALECTKSLVFLLLVCPRSKSILSELGQYTLYPMLLHEPLMRLQLLFGKQGDSVPYPDLHDANGNLAWGHILAVLPMWIGQLCFAVLVTFVFCSFPSRKAFGIFIEPTWVEGCVERIEKWEVSLKEAGRGEELLDESSSESST